MPEMMNPMETSMETFLSAEILFLLFLTLRTYLVRLSSHNVTKYFSSQECLAHGFICFGCVLSTDTFHKREIVTPASHDNFDIVSI